MTSPLGKADAVEAIAIAMQLLDQAISAKHLETPINIELSLLTSHHTTRFPAFFPCPIRNTAACGAARPAGDLPHHSRAGAFHDFSRAQSVFQTPPIAAGLALAEKSSSSSNVSQMRKDTGPGATPEYLFSSKSGEITFATTNGDKTSTRNTL